MTWFSPEVLDDGLNFLASNATKIRVYAGDPSGAGTLLGEVSPISIGAISDGVAGGRRVTVAATSGGSVSTGGDPTYYAILNVANQMLISGLEGSAAVLNQGDAFSTNAFDVIFPDAPDGAFLGDEVAADGILILQSDTNRLYLTSGLVTSYAGLAGNIIGTKENPSISIASDAPNGGRKITVAAINDGVGSLLGEASHYALVDELGDRVLAAGALASPVNVSVNDTWSLEAFDITLNQPSSVSPQNILLHPTDLMNSYWDMWQASRSLVDGVTRVTATAGSGTRYPGIRRDAEFVLLEGRQATVQAEVRRGNHDFLTVNFNGVTTSVLSRACINLSTLETFVGTPGTVSISGEQLADGWVRVTTTDTLTQFTSLRRPVVRMHGSLDSQGFGNPTGTEYFDIRMLSAWMGPWDPSELFSSGELGGWWSVRPENVFSDTAGTLAGGYGATAARLNGHLLNATQGTAGGRPIFGRMPARGVVNYLLNTETPGNAYWQKSFGLTAATGIEDPFGGNNAIRITVEAGVNKVFRRELLAGTFPSTLHTQSFWIKRISGSDTVIRYTLNQAAGTSVAFDGVNWTRINVSPTIVGANNNMFGLSITAPTVENVFDVYGMQIEEGSPASEYQVVGESFYDVFERGGSPTVHYLERDGVDDALVVNLPDLGADATVAFATDQGVVLQTAQTIGAGNYDILRDSRLSEFIVINRALTAGETSSLTAYLETRLGL